MLVEDDQAMAQMCAKLIRRRGHLAVLAHTCAEAVHMVSAFDDIDEEPAKQRDWRPTNPLFRLPNVIITPHAAYYSEQSIALVRRIAAEEAVRVLSGRAPRYPDR